MNNNFSPADLFHDDPEWLAALNAIPREAAEQKHARAVKTTARHSTRRAKSEAHLAELLPDYESKTSVHVISQGDVDSLSYLSHYARQLHFDYCLMSTWCMAMPDVLALREFIDAGRIRRLDCYMGEIFPNQYTGEHAALCDAARACGGRVAVFRNHSKIFASMTERGGLVIESSANVNTNPRCEQTAVHFSDELFAFYKEFFDGVRSFNRDFDDWKPATVAVNTEK